MDIVPILTVFKGLWLIVQRAFFHPLSGFPGPFLAGFTDLYAAYHSLIGDMHLNIQLHHQKYGKFEVLRCCWPHRKWQPWWTVQFANLSREICALRSKPAAS